MPPMPHQPLCAEYCWALAVAGATDRSRGKLESPSIEFGEDSDSILVENLLASVSQHRRQKSFYHLISERLLL